MEAFKEILLNVWKEACRHIEITESLPLIARLLKTRMPLEQMLIRRIDPDRLTVDTLAAGFKGADPEPLASVHRDREQIEKLACWHGKGRIVRSRVDHERKIVFLCLAAEEGRDVMALPLPADRSGLPLLLIIAGPGCLFEPVYDEMVYALQEPLAAAMENDSRLKEVMHLREAAEADRKTLLAKLSRKEMGDVIIGAEGGLKTVLERAVLVADSDVPVLIFGETGTGKEVVARTIHNHSSRAHGPFIRVNCGAIPSELIDSQLFGHEKGAFTGAVETRKGWFERADGGSLFLDEIAEMPLEAQIRLLRILQDGWMERVGGKQALRVDVRIILATHRDLASMVSKGTFRDDLWYRISTFPIFIPPLRDRLEDLPPLAEHFAKRSAIRFSLPFIQPLPEDIRLLGAYSWPGNIRELGTVIDRAALLGNGRCLEIQKALGLSDYPSAGSPTVPAGHRGLKEEGILSLDRVMKNHIEAVLKQTHGRVEGKGGAADLLKINPNTLRARMRKLGVRRQQAS
ncbi:MAG TPA: sigma-54-dependent Fis family transcriptional regulator [bacterium]|nr:sigma-54-dependent Fis family transcriptional regulator [bacterium]